MPQDDRKIVTGIRMPGVKDDKRFTKGAVITDPDELEKVAASKDSGIDLQSLHDAGAITGTWKGVKAVVESQEAKATKKDK